MFSRKVPPTHCVSGSDSIGRHVSRELIASSARRGVMSVLACIVKDGGGGNPPPSGSRCRVLGLVGLQLIVESANDRLELVHRGIVFLREDLLLFLRLRLLVLGEL